MESIAEHIAFKLFQLNRLTNSIQLDIPVAQVQVLQLLDEYRALNLSELASLRQVKMSSMSVMMEQMLNSRMVLKANSKSDRRQRIYLMTNFGKQQLDNARQTMQSKLNHYLSKIAIEDQQSLMRILDQLTEIADE